MGHLLGTLFIMKNMTAQVELKSVDMKMSNGRDFLRCLARLPMAEAYPGYGKVFLGCLVETAAAAHVERPSIKKFENKNQTKGGTTNEKNEIEL